jgi:hypothetical protein
MSSYNFSFSSKCTKTSKNQQNVETTANDSLNSSKTKWKKMQFHTRTADNILQYIRYSKSAFINKKEIILEN